MRRVKGCRTLMAILLVILTLPSGAYAQEQAMEAVAYAVRIEASNGGEVTPLGEFLIPSGEAMTFTLEAFPGYELKDVIANGESLAGSWPKAFVMVKEEMTMTISPVEDMALYIEFQALPEEGRQRDDNASWLTASNWAQSEVLEAQAMGLIPEMLKGADLTCNMTREEFAAVSVTLLERLTGQEAAPDSYHPFADTENVQVLTACRLGLIQGISESRFAPGAILSREQAVTMLTRVYKKYALPGWSLEHDESFPLKARGDNKFADHAFISPWARNGVYFMVEQGIVCGIGKGRFGPQSSITREQALILSLRSAIKFTSYREESTPM